MFKFKTPQPNYDRGILQRRSCAPLAFNFVELTIKHTLCNAIIAPSVKGIISDTMKRIGGGE